MKLKTPRPCACCGRVFMSRHDESRLCSRSCINRLRRMPTPSERFWRRVQKAGPDECWLWTGPLNRGGYGRMQWTSSGHQHQAQRIAWLETFGPIDDGLVVCHSCDVPACCNPAHLFVGTAAENVADRQRKGRHSRGEAHYAARLTESDVRFVLTSKDTHTALAKSLGVSVSAIAGIRNGTKWKEVSAHG
jgi:hypothetical protein